jgi:WD40 repeat protein
VISHFAISHGCLREARRQIASGNATTGALVALEALPLRNDPSPRPEVAEAVEALQASYLNLREKVVLRLDSSRELQFNLEGSLLLVQPSLSNELIVIEASTGRIVWQVEPTHNVLSARFTGDGSAIVAIIEEFDGSAIRYWRTADGAPLEDLVPGETLTHAELSDDGTRLVVLTKSGSIQTWDTAARRRISSLPHKKDKNWDRLSPSGRQLVIFIGERRFEVWNTTDGTRINTISVDSTLGHVSAIGPQGKRLIDADSVLWDVGAARRIAKLPTRAASPELRFSPDGRLLLLQLDQYAYRVIEADTGSSRYDISLPGARIVSAEFSHDGRLIHTASEDSTVRVWEAESGRAVDKLGGHTAFLKSVAISPDSRLLVASDGSLRFWSLGYRSPDRIISGHSAPASIAISANSKWLATGSADGSAAIWDLTTGARLATLGDANKAHFIIAFSPKGTQLLTAGEADRVGVWESPSGRFIGHLEGLKGPVLAAAFSGDGRAVGACGADGCAVWSVDSLGVLARMNSDKEFYALSFSEDGQRLQTRGFGTEMLWNATSGAPIYVIYKRTENDFAYAFDAAGKEVRADLNIAQRALWDHADAYAPQNHRGPDVYGQAYVTERAPFTISVVNVGNSDAVEVVDKAPNTRALLRGHTDRITAAASHGKFIASASNDGTVRLWSQSSESELATLKGHAKRAIAVAFSLDGTRLVTSGEDNMILVWHLPTAVDELARLTCAAVRRDLSAEERRTIFQDRTRDGEHHDGTLESSERPRRCRGLAQP